MLEEKRYNKIIATLGPAIDKKGILKKIDRFVDIYRINLSHADLIKTRKIIKTIRDINTKKVIMLDTKGPEIRTTNLNEIELKKGDIAKIYNKPTEGYVSLEYDFFNNIPSGVEISFNDRSVEGLVKNNNGEYLEIEITSGGKIGFNKTVNFVGYEIESDFLTEKDKKDIKFMVEEDIALLAVSFIKSHKDIIKLKKYIKQNFDDFDVKIIAKIETLSAIKDIENIIKHSDGIMIARGDLGANINIIDLPRIQKKIIKLCNISGKPVILATQVMSSMNDKATPTRAEVDEIAYNIQNGVDVFMLSDETATGNYPIETLTMLNNIVVSYQKDVKELKFNWDDIKNYVDEENEITDYILYSVKKISSKLNVKLIVTKTSTGYAPGRLSALKPLVPILAFTDSDKVFKYCNLMFGVQSYKIGNNNISYEELKQIIGETIQNEFRGDIKGEDKIVIVHSSIGQNTPNMANSIEVIKFKDL